jgi:hypothetical protein
VVADRGLILSCGVFATDCTDVVVSEVQSIFTDLLFDRKQHGITICDTPVSPKILKIGIER